MELQKPNQIVVTKNWNLARIVNDSFNGPLQKHLTFQFCPPLPFQCWQTSTDIPAVAQTQDWAPLLYP